VSVRTIRAGWARRRVAVALLTVAALTLGACGDDDGGGEQERGGQAEGTATVKLAFVPLASMLPVWIAEEQGFFRDHGIELENVSGAEESPTGVPLVMSGEANVALITPTGLIQAAQEDLPVQALTGLTRVGETEERDDSGMVVVEASPVQDLGDLSGKRVALTSLNSSPQWTVQSAIDQAGGDSGTVEFIQSPLSAMQGLLESGEVDAAAIPDPLLPGALADGTLRLLARPNHLVLGGQPALLLFSSKEWISGNAETARSFRAAVGDAAAFIEDPANDGTVREVLGERTEIPAEFVEQVQFNEFSTDLTAEDLTATLEFMTTWAGPQQDPDLAALLPPSEN
jgi:NitT/TauT family transport system substrate-binding protein